MTPKDIDQILTDNGLVIENPNLTNIANEVIAGGNDNGGYKASTASTAYTEFKTAYNALITKLTSGTPNLAEINKDIADLTKYSKKDAFLATATGTGFQAPNSWTIDAKKAAKLASLCGGMIEILRELSTQLAQGNSLDAKKAQKDHGLTDQQLQEIDDLMKN